MAPELGCILASFAGPVAPEWLLRALADGLGGVVLFGSNVRDEEQLARLTRALREAAAGPIVIAADEEGGEVTRLDAPYPGAQALGAVGDPALTEAVAGRDRTRAGARRGEREPRAGRRPSGQPGARHADVRGDLSRHVAAFVAGTQREGVGARAKHFPGHGGARADSHPRATGDRGGARPRPIRSRDRRRRPSGDGGPPLRACAGSRARVVQRAPDRRPAAGRARLRGARDHRRARHGRGRRPVAGCRAGGGSGRALPRPDLHRRDAGARAQRGRRGGARGRGGRAGARDGRDVPAARERRRRRGPRPRAGGPRSAR